jgi:hypothetical protein
MPACTCRLRDAAHEWWCEAAGPSDLVHCRRCDCVDVREEMTLNSCWICTARWLETARAPF